MVSYFSTFSKTSLISFLFVYVVGGGYPRTDDWAPILEAHSNVYLQAHEYLARLKELSEAQHLYSNR
jgi:hypothetical protein